MDTLYPHRLLHIGSVEGRKQTLCLILERGDETQTIYLDASDAYMLAVGAIACSKPFENYVLNGTVGDVIEDAVGIAA